MLGLGRKNSIRLLSLSPPPLTILYKNVLNLTIPGIHLELRIHSFFPFW